MASQPLRRLKRKLVLTTERLAHSVYYTALYGRRFPLGERVVGLAHDWEMRRRLRDAPAPRERWEEQYSEGVWSYMEGLAELGRYSLIAGCLRFLKPDGAVLDVGCGSGILLRRSCAGQYRSYLGIDISEHAITSARAASAREGDVRFVRAEAEEFSPPDRYDAVVFNESLYYLRAPVDLAKRYSASLKPDGILVVSTFRGSRRARAILRVLKAEFELVYELTQRNGSRAWTCSVFAGPAG